MLAKYRNKSNYYIISSIVVRSIAMKLWVDMVDNIVNKIGNSTFDTSSKENMLLIASISIGLFFIGYICMFFATLNYAIGKKYSKKIGTLIGLLDIFGVFIMIFLPDKNQKSFRN
ncbi:MAG: hypothetical protein Tsb0014_04940 [Pleurocapsa sp.]